MKKTIWVLMIVAILLLSACGESREMAPDDVNQEEQIALLDKNK